LCLRAARIDSHSSGARVAGITCCNASNHFGFSLRSYDRSVGYGGHTLRIHTSIEEEIFYPTFLQQAGNEDIHHEAEVEHAGAKHLMDQIESADPADDYFDAKVSVLSEMIKHHVREEEKPGGMSAEARKTKMDLVALGTQLATRKTELAAESERGWAHVPRKKALDSTVLITPLDRSRSAGFRRCRRPRRPWMRLVSGLLV